MATTYDIVCAIYDGPLQSDYVPIVRETDETSDNYGNPKALSEQVAQTTGNKYGYLKPAWKFLDSYYSFKPRVFLSEATEFTATPTVDGTGGSWVLRWRFDPDNESQLRMAKETDPGGFWLWQITETDTPPMPFATGAGLLGPTGIPTTDTLGPNYDYSASVVAPDYLAWGGGGTIDESQIFYGDTGEAYLEVRGLGWGHLLDRCPHHSYNVTVGIAPEKNDSTKSAFARLLRTAIYNLFAWNAEVSKEVSETVVIPSQIGRLLMRPLVTDAAIDSAWDILAPNEIIRIQSGRHSVLDTLQRLAARLGWWMYGNQLGYWIDSIASHPVADWYRGQHFSSFNVKRTAPPAIGYVSTQRDAKWNGKKILDDSGDLKTKDNGDPLTYSDDEGEADRSIITVRYRPGNADIEHKTIVRDFGFVPLTEQEVILLSQLKNTATLTTLTETENLYLQQFGFSEIDVPSAAPDWEKYITQAEIDAMEDGDDKDAEQDYYDNVQSRIDISREETIAIMQQALARRSIADMNILQMDCEMINGAFGAEYGDRWKLGSTVIVHEPGREPQLMIVGQLALRVAGTKDTSVRAGLGHTDNLAAGSRHTFVFQRPWLVSTRQN